MEKISVVMATYNGETFIEEQLLSILKQTRQPDEVLISDDGSTDRTVEIISEFIKKHRLNTWNISAHSHCIEDIPGYLKSSINFIDTSQKSSGGIIFFSDQDDTWDPKKIEIMADIMEQEPQIYTLVCNCNFINENSELIKAKAIEGYEGGGVLSKVTMLNGPLEKSIACGMCMAIRRCILDYMVKINSSHPFSHDYSCGIVASALDGLYFYNKVLASHRNHTNNLTVGVRVSNDKVERLDFYQEQINRFSFITDVLCYFSDESSYIEEKKYYRMCVKINELKLKNYIDKNLFNALLMFRYVPRYIRLRTYIGDIIYLLKLEKFFK